MRELKCPWGPNLSENTPERFLTGPEVAEPTRITSRESYE